MNKACRYRNSEKVFSSSNSWYLGVRVPFLFVRTVKGHSWKYVKGSNFKKRFLLLLYSLGIGLLVQDWRDREITQNFKIYTGGSNLEKLKLFSSFTKNILA